MARESLAIENARIGFRNFKGRPSQYNKDGNKDFVIFLEEEIAHRLENDGWNIRWLDPRTPDESPTPTLRVAVRFDNIPPKIMMVTSHSKVLLDESEVGILDDADIETADVIITPYDWSVNGNHGRKAYLKSMYVTIVEDEFASKYDDLPF